MRAIKTHRVEGLPSDHEINIYATDDPGPGGAHHRYSFTCSCGRLGEVPFQKGGVQKPSDVNGLTNEALLAVVIDRLECFQAGPFPCLENDIALTNCREALAVLKARTAGRLARGVEGKEEV